MWVMKVGVLVPKYHNQLDIYFVTSGIVKLKIFSD